MVEVEGAAEATSPSLNLVAYLGSTHKLLFDPSRPRYRGIMSTLQGEM